MLLVEIGGVTIPERYLADVWVVTICEYTSCGGVTLNVTPTYTVWYKCHPSSGAMINDFEALEASCF